MLLFSTFSIYEHYLQRLSQLSVRILSSLISDRQRNLRSTTSSRRISARMSFNQLQLPKASLDAAAKAVSDFLSDKGHRHAFIGGYAVSCLGESRCTHVSRMTRLLPVSELTQEYSRTWISLLTSIRQTLKMHFSNLASTFTCHRATSSSTCLYDSFHI